MSNFTASIVINKSKLIFHFAIVENPSFDKYYVSVVDGGKEITSFDMKQNNRGKWKVLEPAPSWIIEAEPILTNLIEENVS